MPVHLSVPDEAREFTLSAEVDLPGTLALKPVCLLLPSLEAGVEATIDGRAAVPLVSSMAQPYRAPGPQLFCIDSR